MNEANCETCRYWGSGAHTDDDRPCQIISSGHSLIHICAEDNESSVYTNSTFGCVLHEDFPADTLWTLWRSFEGKPESLTLLALADHYADNNDEERSSLCRLMSNHCDRFNFGYDKLYWSNEGSDWKSSAQQMFEQLFELEEPHRTQVITGNFPPRVAYVNPGIIGGSGSW